MMCLVPSVIPERGAVAGLRDTLTGRVRGCRLCETVTPGRVAGELSGSRPGWRFGVAAMDLVGGRPCIDTRDEPASWRSLVAVRGVCRWCRGEWWRLGRGVRSPRAPRARLCNGVAHWLWSSWIASTSWAWVSVARSSWFKRGCLSVVRDKDEALRCGRWKRSRRGGQRSHAPPSTRQGRAA